MQLLESVQLTASRRKAEFDALGGDWRGQIHLYRGIVAQVTRLQARMCLTFGTPDVTFAPIQKTIIGQPRPTNVYYRWENGPIAPEELEGKTLKFKGACIVQTQQVEQIEAEAVITYRATLKVDENYFLAQMLPSTKSLAVHDPEYGLFDLAIRVPRGELVRESLHALSRELRRKKVIHASKTPRQIFGATVFIPQTVQWTVNTTGTAVPIATPFTIMANNTGSAG